MAKAYISEYKDIPAVHGGALNVESDPVATQVVTYTTATATAAFDTNTKWLRINVDATAHIAHSGTATANSPRYAADSTTYMKVPDSGSLSIYDGTS